MEMASIKLISQPMRGVGWKGKKKGKVKLFIKVEQYFKVTLKMERRMVLEKCIMNHLGTIFKGNGPKMENKVMV